MPGLVNDPYISPGCLHPVFHIIGSFTAGKDVRPPHHPVPVIGMHHIHEFVIKQFLNLVPGIPKYFQKSVAYVGEIKITVLGTAVISPRHVIIKEIQFLIPLF